MAINVKIHLSDGNQYRYEYRADEDASTAREVADQLAKQLAQMGGDKPTATMQRADDGEGHAFTIIPLAAIVRVEVTELEPADLVF